MSGLRMRINGLPVLDRSSKSCPSSGKPTCSLVLVVNRRSLVGFIRGWDDLWWSFADSNPTVCGRRCGFLVLAVFIYSPRECSSTSCLHNPLGTLFALCRFSLPTTLWVFVYINGSRRSVSLTWSLCIIYYCGVRWSPLYLPQKHARCLTRSSCTLVVDGCWWSSWPTAVFREWRFRGPPVNEILFDLVLDITSRGRCLKTTLIDRRVVAIGALWVLWKNFTDLGRFLLFWRWPRPIWAIKIAFKCCEWEVLSVPIFHFSNRQKTQSPLYLLLNSRSCRVATGFAL